MTFSLFRLLFLAIAIIQFAHVTARSVLGQVDRDTERNGMHSCPTGKFVAGVNLRDNLLICTISHGTYSRSEEIVDRSQQNRVRGEELLSCPEGMAMTGYHWRNNVIACAPNDRPLPRFLDAGTLISSGGVVRHSCPDSLVGGIDESRDLLLCGTTGQADRGRTEFIDIVTQRNGMHSCAHGFIVGVDVRRNLLLCSSQFGNYSADDERIERRRNSIYWPTCPEGMAMTGIRVDRHEMTCARVTAGSPSQRVADSQTVRVGIHACPPGKPAASLDGDALICGTSGEPLRGMTITSVTPESPRVGDLVVISGYQLAPETHTEASEVAGVSIVASSTTSSSENFPSRASPPILIPVIQWRRDRILAVLQGPRLTRGEYRLSISDLNSSDLARAVGSNQVRIVVRPSLGTMRNRDEGPTNMPKINRVHPALAMSRQTLDVYGDFPFPDPSTDEVILRPVGPVAVVFPGPNLNFRILRPTTITRNYFSVRLPHLTAGEWTVTVRRRNVESAPERFFVRDVPPPSWERTSQLTGSAGVSGSLVAAVGNVGPNGQSVDLLGYGFGPNQHLQVYIATTDQVEAIYDYVRHRGRLRGDHPVGLHPTFWSDTRIRVEIPNNLIANQRTRGWMMILSDGFVNFSNAVPVVLRGVQ